MPGERDKASENPYESLQHVGAERRRLTNWSKAGKLFVLFIILELVTITSYLAWGFITGYW